MTCIVGIAHEGKVYIGGDSAGTVASTGRIEVRKDPKVFQLGEILVGYCGSFRIGQVLSCLGVQPEHKKGISTHEYLVSYFIGEIRRVLKDNGCMKEENEVEESEAAFVVGYQGKLFAIHTDLQVATYKHSYVAIGSGGPIAEGSLYMTEQFREAFTPRQRILEALKASEAHNAYVRRPFLIKEI